ncbi:MAG: holo-ACP synthase [Candidatus Altiarchaeota archaeon]
MSKENMTPPSRALGITDVEIGIDCVDTSRFEEDTSLDNAFLKKIFTEKEIKYCMGKSKPSQHFAAKFAGKEAVVKALSSFNKKIAYNEVEIINDDKGTPLGKLLNHNTGEFDIRISLSHSINLAVAVAIIFRRNRAM